MSQKISLKDTERKVFTSTFQDGLWDIFIGCFFLQFVIGPFLSRSMGDFWSTVVFLPFFALVYLGIWLIRKHVVTPRVGKVKFGSWRKARLVKFNIVMFVMLFLSLVLGILSFLNFETIPGMMIAARFSLIFLLGFSVAAYFLEFSRLYIYGVLTALSPLVGEWLYVNLRAPHHGFPITFGITAILAILTGAVLFLRLLQEHPIPTDMPATKEVIE
jgi:hypothetical protein